MGRTTTKIAHPLRGSDPHLMKVYWSRVYLLIDMHLNLERDQNTDHATPSVTIAIARLVEGQFGARGNYAH